MTESALDQLATIAAQERRQLATMLERVDARLARLEAMVHRLVDAEIERQRPDPS
jgi:hypothetical protein